MSEASATLHGSRILIAEDEYMIAELLETVFRDAGADVVGPVSRVAEALDIVNSGEHLDAAVLDINLADEQVWPVADALAGCHVPVLLTTGYDVRMIPRAYAGLPYLQKPMQPHAVIRALVRALAAGNTR